MVVMKERMSMSGRMAATFVRGCALAFLVVALVAIGAAPAAAQTFNSGSSGVHGAFPPAGFAIPPNGRVVAVLNMETGFVRYCSSYDFNTNPDACPTGTQLGTAQIPGIPAGGLTTGVFEFTSFVLADRPSTAQDFIVIPIGNSRNNPLTILSQTDIKLGLAAYIYAIGLPGTAPGGVGAPGAGGKGGPGGFAGGMGGIGGSTPTGGTPGLGPAGGAGGILVSGFLGGASAGTSPASVLLTPVVGGSGGGGSTGLGTGPPCSATSAPGMAGAGGGGGGGAVLLAASNEIALTGSSLFSIYTNPGGGGLFQSACGAIPGGSGEYGSVRLVASKISGNGGLSAGRVRIEASTSTYTGSVPANTSFTQFPARPIPTALPALHVTAVNGVAAPANPIGSVATPDINFPTAITGSVTVNIAASNIPVGTVVSVRVVPTNSAFAASTATSTALAGTLDNSTATASIGIPPGVGSMTIAATFQITPLFAQLNLPPVDGGVPALAEVEVGKDGASHFYLLGKEGSRLEMTPEMWKAATNTY